MKSKYAQKGLNANPSPEEHKPTPEQNKAADFICKRELIFEKYGLLRKGVWRVAVAAEWDIGKRRAEAMGKKGYWFGNQLVDDDGNRLEVNLINIFSTGAIMENIDKELKIINTEVQESSEILKKMINDIRAMGDAVEPALLDMIKNLRSKRMAITEEFNVVLGSLKDVRKFFSETDYELEMKKMETFIRVCKEMKQLKEEGILDSVCDSMIRLSLKEVQNVGKQSIEKSH